ncbi:SigB/SigF/SigG family RNA polymerase sigma factor [Nocardiopsis lambiniae]|uniref:SigB/SigF/SigG family RNA polymerase sigma factor n=1 Tax=Nocardiopsis lambiniae TaxID=3075539 RepID=UPI0037C84525
MFPSATQDTSTHTAAEKGLIPHPRRPADHTPTIESSAEDLLTRLHDLNQDDPRAHDLRERVVILYQPLVNRIARDYSGKGEPLEDLKQTAMVGLVKAVRGFDPGRGKPFIAYMRPTVTGEIKRHFRDRTWAVRVPRQHQENRIRMRRIIGEFQQHQARTPSLAELAERMGMSERETGDVVQASEAYRCLSLDMPDSTEGDDDTGPQLQDHLGRVDKGFEHVIQRETLKPALDDLNERERTILHLRFFGDHTQAEIADRLGCSQMHISRLLKGTLEHLREKVGESGTALPAPGPQN